MSAQSHNFLEALFWVLFVWNALLTIAVVVVVSTVFALINRDTRIQQSKSPCNHCPALASTTDHIREAKHIITQTLTNKPPKLP